MWRAVAGPDITTVFAWFRIDANSGEQTGHTAVLTQWCEGQPLRVA